MDLSDEGKITKYIRVRLEHESAIIMLYLRPVAKLSDRAVGEYREAIAVEPAIHAKFDQTVYWNTGKKGSIGYSIYSKDGGELSWYLSAANELKLAWEHAESATLNAGWNHFEVELPSKLSNGSYHLNICDVPSSQM